MSANIANVNTPHLGQEIRRLRLKSGLTLRGLAAKLQISAAHLSDIEHNRRRPSESLLVAIAGELRGVGATLASFEALVTGIDPAMRDWVAETPGIRRLLHRIKDSGIQPNELLLLLDELAKRKPPRKKPGIR